VLYTPYPLQLFQPIPRPLKLLHRLRIVVIHLRQFQYIMEGRENGQTPVFRIAWRHDGSGEKSVNGHTPIVGACIDIFGGIKRVRRYVVVAVMRLWNRVASQARLMYWQ
jgi:hypothetical protein